MARPPGKYSQAARLHDIIRLIESRMGVTVKELVEETGVDRRTIYRDLAAIQDAGYPLCSEQSGREVIYRFIRPMKEIPPISFSLEELFSLSLLRASADALDGTPFHDDITSLFRKITSTLPPRIASHVERISTVPILIPQGKRRYGAGGGDLQTLRWGLLHQKTVRIIYRPSGTSCEKTYLVHPYTLALYRGGIYLIGFVPERHDTRTFALERIQHVEQTDERFEIPAGYTPKRRFAHSFGIVPEPPVTVRIRFSAAVADHIVERVWHPSQSISRGDDGTLILSLRVGGKREIFSWILSHGADAELLSPRAWRQEIAGIVHAMSGHYPHPARTRRRGGRS